MKKVYIAIAAILFAAAGVATVLAVRSHNRMDDFFRANVDALSNTEAVSCPDPYDVKNYKLGFTTEKVCCLVDFYGDVTVAGQKIHVGGFQLGAHVEVSFLLAQCSDYAPGNCCPNSRNGEIQIIGYQQNPDCTINH